jgi:hypothetical protein
VGHRGELLVLVLLRRVDSACASRWQVCLVLVCVCLCLYAYAVVHMLTVCASCSRLDVGRRRAQHEEVGPAVVAHMGQLLPLLQAERRAVQVAWVCRRRGLLAAVRRDVVQVRVPVGQSQGAG